MYTIEVDTPASRWHFACLEILEAAYRRAIDRHMHGGTVMEQSEVLQFPSSRQGLAYRSKEVQAASENSVVTVLGGTRPHRDRCYAEFALGRMTSIAPAA